MATKLSLLDLEIMKLGYVEEENFEILVIDNMIDANFRKPIVDYLKNSTVSIDKKNWVSFCKLHSYG